MDWRTSYYLLNLTESYCNLPRQIVSDSADSCGWIDWIKVNVNILGETKHKKQQSGGSLVYSQYKWGVGASGDAAWVPWRSPGSRERGGGEEERRVLWWCEEEGFNLAFKRFTAVKGRQQLNSKLLFVWSDRPVDSLQSFSVFRLN